MRWLTIGAVIGLLLAPYTPAAEAGLHQASRISDVWPMCQGWQTNLEGWQWITPAELNSSEAMKAVQELGALEGGKLEGEAQMVFAANALVIEGYLLLAQARTTFGSVETTERSRQVFCQWITTRALPE